MDNQFKPFVTGLVLGVVAGGVAGILLAPQSGADTREDIKKFAVDLGEKATKQYNNIKAEVQKRLLELQEAGKKIDFNTYKALVNEVIEEFKKDGEVAAEVAGKLGEQLSDDWNMVKKSVA